MTDHLVLGLGVTGQAVLRALVAHGHHVVAADDRPSASARALTESLEVRLLEAPDEGALAAVLDTVEVLVPSPGLPDRHPAFAAARRAGVAVRSEFDLAREWDRRPIVAITGTNGKTTVTELVRSMLDASGVRAAAVGNTEVPLVAALDDPSTEVFVVEASSFRLLHSELFQPSVGTWLNVAPDHLDNHASLDAYIAAKARLWDGQLPEQVALGNVDDPVVAEHLRRAPGRQESFGLAEPADHRVEHGQLVLAGGDRVAHVDELVRAFPHDLINALAAAASARHGGASVDGIHQALVAFQGLPHRVALVGEAGGVRWYDDSKATAPHAARAAISAFESVVLVAGGRNKGLDLSELAEEAPRIRAVVAIGEAGDEIAAAFDGLRPVHRAASMDEAVAAAAGAARRGDVVLLSPACASFDWYGSYAERGDDFVRAVGELLGSADARSPA